MGYSTRQGCANFISDVWRYTHERCNGLTFSQLKRLSSVWRSWVIGFLLEYGGDQM